MASSKKPKENKADKGQNKQLTPNGASALKNLPKQKKVAAYGLV